MMNDFLALRDVLVSLFLLSGGGTARLSDTAIRAVERQQLVAEPALR